MKFLLLAFSASAANFWAISARSLRRESNLDSTLDDLDFINPIPCHSHNDYLRKDLLYGALQAGCTGLEADVWLKNSELWVARTEEDISYYQSLQSVYLDPLFSLLQERNPDENSTTANGAFKVDPHTTVALLIDLQTNDTSVYDLLSSQLEPFRSRGWLSYWTKGYKEPVFRPITVVATGNASLEQLANNTHRDIFFDAPLGEVERQAAEGGEKVYTNGNSYYASALFREAVGWGNPMYPENIEKIRAQIKAARNQGLKSRYRDIPDAPLEVQRQILEILANEGIGMLEVDDVKEARSILDA